MKETLGDNPITIADARRQGIRSFKVECGPPCRATGVVAFDKLGLPDTTIFLRIPTLKRLRCQSCGRRASRVSIDWSAKVVLGNGRRHVDRWIVVTQLEDGTEGFSSPQWSREEALGFAVRTEDGGMPVLRIEGPAGDLLPDDVAAWRAGRR